MKRLIATIVCVLTATIGVAAHFVFVVPDSDLRTAKVLLSETLHPDPQVDVNLVTRAAFSFRGLDGQETPLDLRPGEAHALSVVLPASARGIIHGVADLGVMAGGSTPHVLIYYPKTIIGDPFDPKTRLGDRVPVEIVPMGKPGAVQLLALGRGTPLANAEVTVLLPDGTQRVVKTSADGTTEVFTQAGRYGAWARYWQNQPGERDGKRYEQLRHYATLVADVDAANAQAGAPVERAVPLTTLPEPTSSFGAVAAAGWLYVYGGHVSPTHNYSTSAVSGRFHRMRLEGDPRWEALPSGPAVQGMNLAAFEGHVYRVGGMQPRNAPGEPEDTVSLADVARFDPPAGRWTALPALPAPRSSHDVVVAEGRLFVIGGWNLKGKGQKSEWPTTIEVLELTSSTPRWTSLPQPFKRRAFIAVTDGRRIYVLGGFDDRNRIVRAVDVYDVASGTWSSGPALPGGAKSGFGPAAAVVDGRVVVSVDDGSLYRLTTDGSAWEPVGQASPRIVHRLVPDRDRVLILGGARAGANLDSVEALRLEP